MTYKFRKTTKCNVCHNDLKNEEVIEYEFKDEEYRQYATSGNMTLKFREFLRTIKLEWCKCPNCGFIVLLSPIFEENIAYNEFFNENYSHYQLDKKAKDLATNLRFFLISRLCGGSNLQLNFWKLLLFPIYDRLMIPRYFLKREDGMSFLDIGYGSGIYVDGFARAGFDSWGIEPFATIPEDLNGTYIREDFLSHDFGEKKFDIIMMKSCLYLVPKVSEYLRKAHLLLKDDGQLVFMEGFYEPTIFKDQNEYGAGAKARQYVYDFGLMRAHLRTTGFECIYENKFPHEYFRKVKKLDFSWWSHSLGIFMDLYYKITDKNRSNACIVTFKKINRASQA